MHHLPHFLHAQYDAIVADPPYGWFNSPPSLIELMCDYAKIKPGLTALEPNGGSGILACAMRDRGLSVDVAELDPRFQIILKQLGFRLIADDFLDAVPTQLYDRILANPPFSSPTQKGVDAIHIKHAFQSFLAPGGRLIAVCSQGSIQHSTCRRARSFRQFLNRINARIIDLDPETFWQSDRPVTVNCCLIIARKRKQLADTWNPFGVSLV